ncbi:MAG: T9SS type A sorting domain-containing protein [Bacteroidetes bacterium]|nr:T9SS type A sorting domain-containing protein [Bacteroidota bacterium]
MKKHIILTCLAFLFAFSIQAQSSFTNAVLEWYNAGYNLAPVPPPGTPGIVGPDYGCLPFTGRQTWFYSPACYDHSLNSIKIYSILYSNSNSDSLGIIIYGPFNSKVTNATDFNSSKILFCGTFDVDIGSTIDFYPQDSLMAPNYYYYVITANNSFDNAATALNINLPFQMKEHPCFECNDKVSQIEVPNFCYLGVDTAINKCELIWEDKPGQNAQGTIIFGQSNSLTYDSIATITIDSLSTFVDLTSSPSQHSFRYKIQAVDSCGNYLAGNIVKTLATIHLLSFPGGNNQAQLLWNALIGSPYYYIFRNSNGSGWQLIDSIGTINQVITYTDIYAPQGSNQYTIGILQTGPCTASKVSSNAYIFSNVTTTLVTATEELTNSNRISIYPNPSSTHAIIDWSYLTDESVTITIYDLKGQMHAMHNNVTNRKMALYTSALPKGIYYVNIAGSKTYKSKLVVVQ